MNHEKAGLKEIFNLLNTYGQTLNSHNSLAGKEKITRVDRLSFSVQCKLHHENYTRLKTSFKKNSQLSFYIVAYVIRSLCTFT